MSSIQLKGLIDDYLSRVKQAMFLFEEQLGEVPPLTAWHDKLISKSGFLSDGIEYEFHGVGCSLSFIDCEVDFDFGPKGRTDGFDLWRLSHFAKSHSRYENYVKKGELDSDFAYAIEQGFIHQIDHSYCKLYFLN